MAQDDNRVSKFVTAITREAEEQKLRIEQETKDFIARELEKAEMEALQDSYKLIQRSASNIRIDIGCELSAKLMENRRVLLQRREAIANEVMKEAAEKVEAFVRSPEYEDFLVRSAAKTAALFGGRKVTFFVAPGDIKFRARLEAAVPGCTVNPDDSIRLGGLRTSDGDGKRVADDTLDARLASQREWFRKNSGLIVS